MVDKYFWRQLLVVICVLIQGTIDGISTSLSGFIHASLVAANTIDVRGTPAEASWIVSAPGFGLFVGVLISYPLLQFIGRRATQATFLTFEIVSWTTLYFASSIPIIILARVINGLGGGVFINGVMISEYCDAKRRGYFLTMRKLSAAMGALICHISTIFLTWRQITLIAIPSLWLSLILTLFWKESPAHCAYKGDFGECERNFIWLHGKSKEKEKELKHLVAAQMARLEKERNNKGNEGRLIRYMKSLLQKDFLKAFLVSILTILILDLSGRCYYFIYIKQIFMTIIHDDSISAYCTIINDLLSIIGLTLSCVLVKKFQKRALILVFGSITVVLMFLISLCDGFLLKYSGGVHHKWITPSLLIILNFIVCLSLLPVCFTLAIEVFPLDHRGLCLGIARSFSILIYIVSIKFTPMVLDNFGLSATYGLFGVGLTFCLAILYMIVPETKDKTMQEINDEMKNLPLAAVELQPILIERKN